MSTLYPPNEQPTAGEEAYRAIWTYLDSYIEYRERTSPEDAIGGPELDDYRYDRETLEFAVESGQYNDEVCRVLNKYMIVVRMNILAAQK